MKKSIHNSLYKQFIELLKQKRIDKGITQTELAQRLGVSQSLISKFEMCEIRIDLVELVKICNAMQIPFIDIANEMNEIIVKQTNLKL